MSQKRDMGHPILWMWMVLLLGCLPAFGSGARYVSGPPFFTAAAGVPVGWKGPQLAYYTDPGDLSAFVNHAQADALVASAAGVWNVPVASITVSRGGALAEHVSGANVYLGSGGMVYPDDVSSANYAARPIAVIYDADGSVTDTLLGAGASAPASCRQNAVTESVDRFDPAGYILHAIVILNGRCTAAAAAAQSEMQYKLERVFGRVLGLAWSQANDNVFTGSPVATYQQALHWPLMHPVEIICGTYSYQCMPSPFTLRPDDVASMVLVYPITTAAGATAAGAGKTISLAAAALASGTMVFPTGEGMAGVNVLATRDAAGTTTAEGWVQASGLTGAMFRRNGLSGFVAADASAWGSMGSTQTGIMGGFTVPYVELPSGQGYVNIHLRTEAVNALYTGQYGVGPYGPGAVMPSGTAPATQTSYGATANTAAPGNFAPSDAASVCGNGLDGFAAQPVAVVASGWWQGIACGYGHVSYSLLPMRAGRTFTVEVTAQDAQGLASTAKMMPVMGLWGESDATSSLPTQGVAATAFQARGVGMTTLSGTSGTLVGMRLGIADQRGDGRPDYTFQARYFYADNVVPAQLPAAGGTVTIAGYGFKAGNAVYVNGVAGTVTAWTANSLTVTTPTMSQAGATSGTAVDVRLTDLSTGATSTMSGALTYVSGVPVAKTMKLVSAQVADVVSGSVAPVPFAVQMLLADGMTPVPGERVVFSVVAGTAGYGACAGAASCTVVTDAQGMASTAVTPGAAGTVTMQAADGTLTQQASFNALVRNSRMDVIQAPSGTQVVGVAAQPDFMIRLFGPDGYAPVNGRTIMWTVTAGSAILGSCVAPVCATATASNGVTSMTITPLLPGTITVTASDGSLTQTISFQAVLSLDTMVVTNVPPSPATVGVSAGMFSIRLIRPAGYGDYYQPVVFSAPAGISFDQCGANPCTVSTNSQGDVGANVTPTAAGTYTLTATFGTGVSSVSQTATLTATVKTITRLRITSMPSNHQPVGQYTDKPFTVLLLQADGSPAAYTGITLSGASDSVVLDCGRAACLTQTDANGYASARVIPLHAGTIGLSASMVPFLVSGTFTAVAATKLMTVVSQPANGTYVGDAAAMTVQVLQPDGATPAPGDTVVFSVTSGAFGFGSCGATTCSVVTDANGRATVTGMATAAGSVTLTATDGNVSQAATFTTVGHMDLMQIVLAPLGKVTAGGVAAVPFAVRVMLPDGVTPAAGRTVMFAVSVGYAGFGACPTVNCTVTTDATGMAQTTVSTVAPGSVTLEAIDTSPGQTAYVLDSFTAVGPGDGLRVLSQPSDGTVVYDFDPKPLTVQLLGPDGVSPVAGQSVTIATTVGYTGTTLCNGGPGCLAVSDAQGMVTTQVRPLTTGTVTMTATAGALQQSVSFQVLSQPDTLQLVSGPADGSLAGGPAATPFAVRVTQADGTAGAGRGVVLSVTAGTATFGACGAATCTVTADASGVVSSTVTPGAAGAVSLLATDGNAQISYGFQAAARPDALAVVTSPANGGPAGVASSPSFAVRVTGGFANGPLAGRTGVFTVVSGSATLGCGATTCQATTDAQGLANVGVTPGVAGTVVLQASEGGAWVQVTFTVQGPHGLRLVSVPADGSYVGVVASPGFAVQVVLADGVTAVAGEQVTVSATNGTVCGAANCVGVSDAGGMVQMGVTPTAAGAVRVQAVDGAATVSTTFNAVARPDVLSLVSAPSGSGTVGVVMPAVFSVRLLAADGSARAGVAVVFSIMAGGSSFSACSGASGCSVLTDASGLASSSVTPTAAGAVTISAASEGTSVSASFTALPAPDSITVEQGPGASVYVGDSVPFSVRVTLADGVTPAPGVQVTFSATTGAGQVSFDACDAASCTIATDARGLAAMGVTGVAPGALSLIATADASSRAGAVQVPLQVLANVYGLSGSAPVTYVAEGTAFRDEFQATATRNGAAVSGVAVSWTGSGSAAVNAASSTTDVAGLARMQVGLGPLAAGATGAVEACAWTQVCAEFGATGVANEVLAVALVSGATQTLAAGQSPVAMVAAVTDGAGHPVAGAAVTVFQTMFALVSCPARGRCPAAAVLGTRASVLVSGVDGTITVQPMSGAGTETKVEFTVGTAGVAIGDVAVGS